VPYWLRITRSGNSFSSYVSPDGASWTQVGTTQTINMTADPVYIGLGVAGMTGVTTVKFDNVDITGNVGAPPQTWLAGDVGSVGVAGSATYDEPSQSFTLQGSGTDINGTADEFQFVRREPKLSGDGSITARVVSVQNTDAWAKAGVMIRETTAAGSKNIVAAMTPGQGATLQQRTSTGGSTAYVQSTGISAPYWVRLTRVGNVITGYRSSDGSTWVQLGTPQTVSMATDVEVGLATTAHDNGVLCTAVFDNVVITP
jgi:regulation of enolase protein 1 (concanavalin A-like superfamily)